MWEKVGVCISQLPSLGGRGDFDIPGFMDFSFFGFYDFVDWSMPGRTGSLDPRVPRDRRFVDLRGLLISGCFDLCDLGGPCISRFLGFVISWVCGFRVSTRCGGSQLFQRRFFFAPPFVLMNRRV